MNFIFTLFLFLLAHTSQASSEMAPEVVVKAEALRLRDEVTPEAHSVSLDQPSGQVDLAPALRRLPGVMVRDRSGPGSLITAFPSQSLTAGDVQVSVDDIPVINPLGTGINFSLFPAPLVEKLETRTAFDSSLKPIHDPRPAPGGRLNLQTLGAPQEGDSSLRGGLLYGLGNTGQGTAIVRGGDKRSHHVAGATVFTTDGAFRYKHPVSGEVESRGGNDATGAGALGKKTWLLGHDAQAPELTALVIGSHLDRSVPGALTRPNKDHEKDDFHLLGLKFVSPRTFAKVSGTHTRTGVRGQDPASSTDDRFYTAFAQAGVAVVPPSKALTAYVILDNEYDWYHSNDGAFHRNVTGVAAQARLQPVATLPLSLAPLIRQDIASEFSGARDYRLTALYDLDAATEISLGFAFDHAYPAITAFSGYTSPFGQVRPNRSLGTERHRLWTLSGSRKLETSTVYASLFYDRATNRSTFGIYNDGTAQYVALPEVTALGGTLDGQWFPSPLLSLRGSVTVQKAEDALSRRELPYKPRLQALASIGVRPLSWLLASLEETYIGRRRFATPDDAVQGELYLAPFFSTGLRLDAQVTPRSLVFFRVNNLWDRAGWDSPGYPLAGRSFWFGYTYGE